MSLALVVLCVLFVAYTNGANDNFKGVATLFGSGTTDYRWALAWGTVTTFAGSLTALVLSDQLVKTFTGSGLVSDTLVGAPAFVGPVALAAASTVFLATLLSYPISTTHALTGSLIGAGWVLGGEVHLDVLGSPAPLVAVAVQQEQARETVLAIPAQRTLDAAHYLSAGTVSFARGLNDTPKIVALLLATQAMGLRSGLLLVGGSMAVGAVLSARRVAETLGKRITTMSPGQGLAANLVTTALVLGASRLGVPVSTTHVSCGALFGLGAVTGQAQWKVVASIVLAWVITLPVATVLAALAAFLLAS